jgi:hypothetical protein
MEVTSYDIRPEKQALRQDTLDCFELQVLLARCCGFPLDGCDEDDATACRRSEDVCSIMVLSVLCSS